MTTTYNTMLNTVLGLETSDCVYTIQNFDISINYLTAVTGNLKLDTYLKTFCLLQAVKLLDNCDLYNLVSNIGVKLHHNYLDLLDNYPSIILIKIPNTLSDLIFFINNAKSTIDKKSNDIMSNSYDVYLMPCYNTDNPFHLYDYLVAMSIPYVLSNLAYCLNVSETNYLHYDLDHCYDDFNTFNIRSISFVDWNLRVEPFNTNKAPEISNYISEQFNFINLRQNTLI